ncbi:MAG: hypothetical protein JXA42_21075 [Anaerolineales bacterium]|nr:hypothetical protein [Anaerolineales bacterium]
MNNLIEQTIATIRRVRRNHALEHAAIHVLTRTAKNTPIYARSTPLGLVVYGNLATEEVANAASEALSRLKNGEHHLAVHPNCGTNLVTAGGLSAMAALVALNVQQKTKKKWNLWHLLGALPMVVLASAAALIVAQPLGQALQLNMTTESRVGNLHITSITRHNQGRLVFHIIKTAE